MDLNGLNVTIFVEEGLAVYVVSRDMVLRDIDSANLDGSVQLSSDLTISDVDSSHAATSSCCAIYQWQGPWSELYH